MYDLETLKTMHLRASGAVRIVFLTAVFVRAGVQAGYPGGVPGFRKDYPHAREDRDLLTVSSMSSGELGDILDAIAAKGLDLVSCCAVADVFGGPLETCDAIEIFSTRDGFLDRGWMARLRSAATQASDHQECRRHGWAMPSYRVTMYYVCTGDHHGNLDDAQR